MSEMLRAVESMQLVPELFEIEFQISNRLVALQLVLRQSLRDDSFELSWHVAHVFDERSWFVIDDRNARVTVGLAFERRLTAHHFIKHHTETENIGSRIDAFALCLLRRHVTAR